MIITFCKILSNKNYKSFPTSGAFLLLTSLKILDKFKSPCIRAFQGSFFLERGLATLVVNGAWTAPT